jgi:uncharacterized membrane protein YsdA (DUF1294 family)
MGVDPLTALSLESRIPEKWFFTISMAGGPFGVFLGMVVFHHKTRKTYFGFTVTLMLMIYVFVLIVLIGLKASKIAELWNIIKISVARINLTSCICISHTRFNSFILVQIAKC